MWFATPEEAFEAHAGRRGEDDDGGLAEDSVQGFSGSAETVDFDSIDASEDAPEQDDEQLMTSAEAEADAVWDSVLEDVGLSLPGDGGDLDAAGASGEEEDEHLDIETFAARRPGAEPDDAFAVAAPAGTKATPKVQQKRPPRIVLAAPLAMAASLLLAVALIGTGTFVLRNQVVALLPGTAGLYAMIGYPVNLRGIEFANVTFVKGVENGLPVLAVSGEIVNITDSAQPVPDLRFSLRNELSQEIYHWTGRAEAGELGPAGRARFLTRLAAPPAAAREIQVRFTGEARASDGLRS